VFKMAAAPRERRRVSGTIAVLEPASTETA